MDTLDCVMMTFESWEFMTMKNSSSFSNNSSALIEMLVHTLLLMRESGTKVSCKNDEL